MNTVSFLYLYDSTSIYSEILDIEGLTNIDLHGNETLYNQFATRSIDIDKLPILIISYNKIIKSYPYNKDNIEEIKNKIKILLNKA